MQCLFFARHIDLYGLPLMLCHFPFSEVSSEFCVSSSRAIVCSHKLSVFLRLPGEPWKQSHRNRNNFSAIFNHCASNSHSTPAELLHGKYAVAHWLKIKPTSQDQHLEIAVKPSTQQVSGMIGILAANQFALWLLSKYSFQRRGKNLAFNHNAPCLCSAPHKESSWVTAHQFNSYFFKISLLRQQPNLNFGWKFAVSLKQKRVPSQKRVQPDGNLQPTSQKILTVFHCQGCDHSASLRYFNTLSLLPSHCLQYQIPR